MSPTLTTFLFEAANFLVLAAALSWLFFRPVRRMLADRRAQFEAEAKQAAEQLAAAENMRREADAERDALQAELSELRGRELETARRQAEQIVSDARNAAEREREMSRRQAARMSDTRRDRLAEAAAAAGAETVRQLLQQLGGPPLQELLLQSACQQLRSLPPGSLAPVKVESAEPLTPPQRAALNEALGPAAVGAEFRTDDELGAGVRIATGSGLIDATSSGLARYARQALAGEMNRGTNNHHSLQSGGDD